MLLAGIRWGWMKCLGFALGIALAYVTCQAVRGPARIAAARRAIEAEDYTGAERRARPLVRSYLPKRRHAARLVLAEALLHQGRLEECKQQLNRLPREWAKSSAAQMLLAGIYLAEQESLRAESIFRWIVDRSPDEQKAHRWLAAIYYDLGHINGALKHLDKVEELCPDDPKPRVLKAVIHMDSERYRDAAASYTEALRCEPDNFSSRVGLADALVRQGDVGSAQVHLTRCRRERPDEPDVLVLQAECLRSQGALEDAAALLDQVLRADPQHTRALLGRAKLHLETRQPEEALSLLQRILDADAYDWQAHYLSALALVRLGKSEAAEQAFEKVRRTQDLTRQLHLLNEDAIARPRDPHVRHRLGQVCVELGKAELAEMWFRAALMLDADHTPTHQALGEFYAQMGVPDRAEWHAKKAAPRNEVASP